MGGQECLVYQEGIGVGGTAVDLGETSSLSACVGKTAAEVPEANGVTFLNNGCEARIGQLYVEKSSTGQNCFIMPQFDSGRFTIPFLYLQDYKKLKIILFILEVILNSTYERAEKCPSLF